MPERPPLEDLRVWTPSCPDCGSRLAYLAGQVQSSPTWPGRLTCPTCWGWWDPLTGRFGGWLNPPF